MITRFNRVEPILRSNGVLCVRVLCVCTYYTCGACRSPSAYVGRSERCVPRGRETVAVCTTLRKGVPKRRFRSVRQVVTAAETRFSFRATFAADPFLATTRFNSASPPPHPPRRHFDDDVKTRKKNVENPLSRARLCVRIPYAGIRRPWRRGGASETPPPPPPPRLRSGPDESAVRRGAAPSVGLRVIARRRLPPRRRPHGSSSQSASKPVQWSRWSLERSVWLACVQRRPPCDLCVRKFLESECVYVCVCV